MAELPGVTVKLSADISDFVRGWTEAAAAAEAASNRIRAAGDGLGSVGDGARRGSRDVDEFGRTARRTGDDVDSLGRRAAQGGSAVDSLGSAFSKAAGNISPTTALLYGLVASALPGLAAAALAGGAAIVGLGAAAGVAALGSRGLGQAFDVLARTTAGLRSQLDSVFRQGLMQEFSQLGNAIKTQLGDAMKGVASAIVDVTKETSEWIRSADGINTLKDAFGGVRDLVEALGPGLKALVQLIAQFAADAAPAMHDIGAALSYVVQQLQAAFSEAAKSGDLGKAFSAGAQAIKGFGDILKGVIDILIQMASQGGPQAADAFQKFGKALSDSAPVIGAIFAALSDILDVLATSAAGWGELMKAVAPAKDVFKEAILAMFPIIDLFQKIDKAADAAGPAIQKFASISFAAVKDFSKSWMDAQQAVEKFAATVGMRISKFVQDVKADWEKLKQDIGTSFKAAWDAATQPTIQGVNKIIQAVTQFVQRAKQNWTTFKTDAQNAFRDAFNDAVSAAKDGIDKVIDAVAQLPGKLKAEWDGMVKDAKDAGSHIVEGLADGIKSAVGNAVAAAKAMAQMALQAIKQELGIASPSQVFHDEVGVHIPAGIAAGILANRGVIADALRLTTSPQALGQLGVGRGAAYGALGGAGGAAGQAVTFNFTGNSDDIMATWFQKQVRAGRIKVPQSAIVK